MFSLTYSPINFVPLPKADHIYSIIPNSGGAFRVSIYTPYVILNKTGLDINIKSKTLLQQARAAAGQVFHTNSDDSGRSLTHTFDGARSRGALGNDARTL